MSTPARVDSLLLEVADVVNATLDLDTLMRRVSELIKRVIDYEIFAILLLNEKTQELRIRFQVGHPPELAERTRVKLGEGVTGLAAANREAVLVNDVREMPNFIETAKGVRSELAIPLIVKNRVIGVIDIEASVPNSFTVEHRDLLTLIGSRIAIGIENARLYTRISKQAKTLILLNEISRELTSILDLDQLLKRIGDLLTRIIDYQMFSILLLDSAEAKLVQPTFLTEFPLAVSPLARKNDRDGAFCDRFELFVNGRELANGFSATWKTTSASISQSIARTAGRS